MKLVAVSDLHGNLDVTIPPCDVLVIPGDVAPDFRMQKVAAQENWLLDTFDPWLNRQPASVIIGIAGNHDFALEKTNVGARLSWTYLNNDGVTVDGVKFWGIPHVPNLSHWAFHADDIELQAMFDSVPDDVDVLISHGPPFGYGDRTVPRYGDVHAGFMGGVECIDRVRPPAFLCGHIHEGFGAVRRGGTMIYNVAHMDENYQPRNIPLVLDPADSLSGALFPAVRHPPPVSL